MLNLVVVCDVKCWPFCHVSVVTVSSFPCWGFCLEWMGIRGNDYKMVKIFLIGDLCGSVF